MAWKVGEPSGSTTIPTGAGYIRDNNSQIQLVLTSARLLAGTEIKDPFSFGGVVKSWFYLDSAPTGWTLVSSLGDTLLAVKGGTTYTTGAATTGTWTQEGTALTIAQTPAHTHDSTLSVAANSGSGGSFFAHNSSTLTSASALGGAATGAAHSHGATWRPAARVGIICSLD